MSTWRDLAYSKAKSENLELNGKATNEAEESGEEEENILNHTGDTELSKKLYDILGVLKAVDNHEFVSFEFIQQKTGIDLDSPLEAELRKALERNEKVYVDGSITPTKIKFKPKFSIQSIDDLLAALERNPDGVSISDIVESSSDQTRIDEIISQAVVTSLVIAVKRARSNTEIVFYPRSSAFLVPLSGKFSSQKGRQSLQCTTDVRNEIHRGDTVLMGNNAVRSIRDEKLPEVLQSVFRVSVDTSSIDSDADMATTFSQLSKNSVPFSSSSRSETLPPKDKEFKYRMSEKKFPLSPARNAENLDDLTLYKHGCTNDIRDIWARVSEKTCFNIENKLLLLRELAKEGLLTESEIKAQNGPKSLSKVNDGKRTKKRRRRQNRVYKVTNIHMESL